MKHIPVKYYAWFLIVSIVFLCLCSKGYGQQVFPSGNPTSQSWIKGGQKVDSAFVLPWRKSAWPWQDSIGRICYDRYGDSSIYYHNGIRWIKIGSGSGADSSIFATVYDVDTAKQNIRDTRIWYFPNGTESINYTTNDIITIGNSWQFTVDGDDGHYNYSALTSSTAGVGFFAANGDLTRFDITGSSTDYLAGNGTWQPIPGGSGTVTTVTVTPGYGVSSSVSNPTTTPDISIDIDSTKFIPFTDSGKYWGIITRAKLIAATSAQTLQTVTDNGNTTTNSIAIQDGSGNNCVTITNSGTVKTKSTSPTTYYVGMNTSSDGSINRLEYKLPGAQLNVYPPTISATGYNQYYQNDTGYLMLMSDTIGGIGLYPRVATRKQIDSVANIAVSKVFTVTGTSPINVTSGTSPVVSLIYSTTPTASTVSEWDANVNMSGNNLIAYTTSTATAGGTTTLSVTSTYGQDFTGTSNQTIVLPVTSTLHTGLFYYITNLSTGTLTVNASDGSLVQTMVSGSTAIVKCTSISVTTNAAWTSYYGPPVTTSSNASTIVQRDANGAIAMTTLTATGNTTVSIPSRLKLVAITFLPASGSESIKVGTTNGGTEVMGSTSFSSTLGSGNSISFGYRMFSTSGATTLYLNGASGSVTYYITIQ